MKAADLIRSRRTIHEWEPLGLARETIAALLATCVYAPNHHLTQPWHFIVARGQVKERLAALRGRATAAGAPASDAAAQAAAETARAEMADAAAVVVFTCADSPDPLRAQEDLCATAAAVQNFCLAAWDLSLGTAWTTGPLATDPAARELLAIPAADRIVGIVLLGYPASVPPLRRRTPAAHVTRWAE